MFKKGLSIGLTGILTVGLILVMPLSAAEKQKDPMKPPPFALKKFAEAKNKLKAKNRSKVSKPVIAKKVAPVEPLQLTSILISANRRIAIINDQMLVVGDSIKKARLTGIEKDHAKLVRNGKKITLQLNADSAAIRKNAIEKKL